MVSSSGAIPLVLAVVKGSSGATVVSSSGVTVVSSSGATVASSSALSFSLTFSFWSSTISIPRAFSIFFAFVMYSSANFTTS